MESWTKNVRNEFFRKIKEEDKFITKSGELYLYCFFDGLDYGWRYATVLNDKILMRSKDESYCLDSYSTAKEVMEVLEAQRVQDTLSEILSLQEAAELWNMDDSTLRKAIAAEKFGPNDFRKTGRNYIIRKSSMEQIYGKQPKLETIDEEKHRE